MNRLLLSVLSLLAVAFLLAPASEALAGGKCKKKKKKARSSTVAKQGQDSIKVFPAPGVPDKKGYDSLKNAKMIEKLKTGHALVVSFISVGAGIDLEAAQQFEKALAAFNEKNSCRLVSEQRTWGREGERDYCVVCTDEDCLSRFATGVKTSLKGNTRVLIQEHTACRQ